MKKLFLFFSSILIIITIFISLHSCSDKNENLITKPNNEKPTELYKEADEKPDSDSSKALACDQRIVVVWEFEKYVPVTGKTIGISSKMYSSYSDLRTKDGFSEILIPNESERDAALNAGFNLNNMMASVTANSFGYFGYPSGDFGYYHLDEPLEREYPITINNVITIANSIYQANQDADLLLSSWK